MVRRLHRLQDCSPRQRYDRHVASPPPLPSQNQNQNIHPIPINHPPPTTLPIPIPPLLSLFLSLSLLLSLLNKARRHPTIPRTPRPHSQGLRSKSQALHPLSFPSRHSSAHPINLPSPSPPRPVSTGDCPVPTLTPPPPLTQTLPLRSSLPNWSARDTPFFFPFLFSSFSLSHIFIFKQTYVSLYRPCPCPLRQLPPQSLASSLCCYSLKRTLIRSTLRVRLSLSHSLSS